MVLTMEGPPAPRSEKTVEEEWRRQLTVGYGYPLEASAAQSDPQQPALQDVRRAVRPASAGW